MKEGLFEDAAVLRAVFAQLLTLRDAVACAGVCATWRRCLFARPCSSGPWRRFHVVLRRPAMCEAVAGGWLRALLHCGSVGVSSTSRGSATVLAALAAMRTEDASFAGPATLTVHLHELSIVGDKYGVLGLVKDACPRLRKLVLYGNREHDFAVLSGTKPRQLRLEHLLGIGTLRKLVLHDCETTSALRHLLRSSRWRVSSAATIRAPC
eukprot:TRINITY_DN2400_c0_g1_i2.p1 TRINITY_DN2400_c0_g1~~TRINITY_DN2400_c0_g1_i2.p1  ORF type:complete len:209 (-),score=40.38 TRINITY_DN2400_c0_g1_i2:606-1232(-)